MPKSKEELLAKINQVGTTHRLCAGTCPKSRDAPPKINADERKISFTLISQNNAGERYDWWEDEVYIEELDIKGAKYDNLRTFFTDHKKSVDNAIGRVENVRIENSELVADVIFGEDERSQTIFKKYQDGILNDVSIGYIVNDVVITEKKDEPTHVLVTDFEIVELSAVWRGFDAGAKAKRSFRPPKATIKAKPKGNIETRYKKLKLIEKGLI